MTEKFCPFIKGICKKDRCIMWVGGECRLVMLIDLYISSKIYELYGYEDGAIEIDVEEEQDAS
ncbi:hypothetical protein JH146_0123 [Methanocaldococcus bathoardescens]|uniref:Uncharacterized protein n=1 Tax=Methanocaldococcus bathoardescens TaxID=1301915 RepID=A0A076LHH0_9EURY|nr:hypothetical protein [Methanocaldococcus bathoardescens]AIJ04974.1 hypothetical protein JH146_0123 [Methanocaldococcus bathoardescens]